MMTKEQKQALIARCNYLIGGAPEIDVQLAEFALAVLTQPASTAFKLPDGWVAVPLEPSSEMLLASKRYKSKTKIPTGPGVYRAMLKAAPSNPHTAQIEPICATGGAEWVKCDERMPKSKTGVLVGCWFGREWTTKWATYIPGHPDANISGWLIPGASWLPSHWQPLPSPPKS